jgi:Tol biopolymer transport system component
VSMVPDGTVAAVSRADHSGQAAAIYLVNMDGSDLIEVKQSIAGTGYFVTMAVGWLSARKLVYHDTGRDLITQLYTLDRETGETRRFLGWADEMEMEIYPRVDRERNWVYFGGGSFEDSHIHRARTDGTGVERVSPASAVQHQSEPAPSPDGRELAYVTFEAGFPQLEVMDLATGETRKLNVRGKSPSWSPDGTRIAFIYPTVDFPVNSGVIGIVNPDGTGLRTMGGGTIQFTGTLDWSPDGAYIVGSHGDGRLAVVEVATETELRLFFHGFERRLSSPVWRP